MDKHTEIFKLKLEMAGIKGDLDVLRSFREHEAEFFYKSYDLCLQAAVSAGHVDVVRYLHEQGASLSLCNTAAIRAAIKNGYWSVLKYLFHHGYKIDADILQDDIKNVASLPDCDNTVKIAKNNLLLTLNHPSNKLLPNAGVRWETYALWSRVIISHLKSQIDAIHFAQDAYGHGGFESRQKGADLHSYVAELEAHLTDRFPNFKDKFVSFTESDISNDETSCIFNDRRVSGPMYANMTFFLECVSRVPKLETVCEIGGGYGGPCRLWLTNEIHQPKRYVIVDLPESLFFIEVFLRQELGKDRVYYVSDENVLDANLLNSFDIILCPVSFISSLRNISFDLVYNTLSMQEMSEEYIDFYAKWLDNQSINYFYSFNYAAQSSDRHPESANNCSPRFSEYWHPIWIAPYAAGESPAMHILVENHKNETKEEIICRGKKLLDFYMPLHCDNTVFLYLFMATRMMNDACTSCLVIEKVLNEMPSLPRELWVLLNSIPTQNGVNSLSSQQQNILSNARKTLLGYQQVAGKASPHLEMLSESLVMCT